jgi:hypothetical protein
MKQHSLAMEIERSRHATTRMRLPLRRAGRPVSHAEGASATGGARPGRRRPARAAVVLVALAAAGIPALPARAQDYTTTISTSPAAPHVGEVVTFSLSSVPPPGHTVHVEFGDGSHTSWGSGEMGWEPCLSRTTPCPQTHVYSHPGTVTVTVEYLTGVGATVKGQLTLSVLPAFIAAAPEVPHAGETVTFTLDGIPPRGHLATVEFGDGSQVIWGLDDMFYEPCHSRTTACPLTHVYAEAGTYTLVVTYPDEVGRVVTKSRALAVLQAPTVTTVIPSAAHLAGLNGTLWRTDLELHNPGPAQASCDLTLLPRDHDNSSPGSATRLTVPPGASVRVADVLQSVFGFSGAAAIRIETVNDTLVATSRTYNQLHHGSYGARVPALAAASAIQPDQEGRLVGLDHDPSLAAGARTNIGLVNATALPTHVEVDLHSGDGWLLGTTAHDLPPYGNTQLDRVFESVTSARVDDGYAIVRTTTGSAAVFAYASVVDNVTGDGDQVPALVGPAAAGEPQAVDLTGAWSGTVTCDPGLCADGAAGTFISRTGSSVFGILRYGEPTSGGTWGRRFRGTLSGNTLSGTTFTASETLAGQVISRPEEFPSRVLVGSTRPRPF